MVNDIVHHLIEKLDGCEIIHYESDYYDPAKAHEYYMKNRKLIGRSTSGLSNDGKDIWRATKSNIDYKKKTNKMEANLNKEVEIQNARSKAESTRISIINKLKDLSDKLNAKYKSDTTGLSKEQKAQLEVISREREKEKERIQKAKENKIEKINKDDNLSTEEKQKKKGDVTKKSSDDLKDVTEEFSKKSEDTRSEISNQREKLSTDKKETSTKNSTDAKTERVKVAVELKNAIQKARDDYNSKKASIDSTYEDTYQTEYDKIKSQYQSTKKRK